MQLRVLSFLWPKTYNPFVWPQKAHKSQDTDRPVFNVDASCPTWLPLIAEQQAQLCRTAERPTRLAPSA